MRRCTKCGRTADETPFYATGSTCCDCKRAASRAHRSIYYQSHADQVRAYARAYSRRRYSAMTEGERRAHNRQAWRRWGRPRYLRERGRTAGGASLVEDPELRRLLEQLDADATTLDPQNSPIPG